MDFLDILEDLSYATEGVSENFGALDKKIKGLIDKAKNAVKRGKYQEAIGYCDEGIKDIDTFKAGVKSGNVKSKAVKVVIGAVVSLLAVAATVMLVKKGKGKGKDSNNNATAPVDSANVAASGSDDEPTGSGSTNRRSVSRGTGKRFHKKSSSDEIHEEPAGVAEPVQNAKSNVKRVKINKKVMKYEPRGPEYNDIDQSTKDLYQRIKSGDAKEKKTPFGGVDVIDKNGKNIGYINKENLDILHRDEDGGKLGRTLEMEKRLKETGTIAGTSSYDMRRRLKVDRSSGKPRLYDNTHDELTRGLSNDYRREVTPDYKALNTSYKFDVGQKRNKEADDLKDKKLAQNKEYQKLFREILDNEARIDMIDEKEKKHIPLTDQEIKESLELIDRNRDLTKKIREISRQAMKEAKDMVAAAHKDSINKFKSAQDSYLYYDDEISMEAAIGNNIIDKLKGFLKGGSDDTNAMLSALDAAKASLANIKAQCQSMLRGKAAKESVLFSLETALEEAEYDSQDLFNDGILEYIFATENDSYLVDLLELGLDDQIAYETYVDLTEI